MAEKRKTVAILGVATLAGEGWLQVSGYQNIYLAWVLGCTAAIFLFYGGYSWAAEKWPGFGFHFSFGLPVPARMSLIEFYHRANQKGWDLRDGTGHVFGITDGLKQAGADGVIRFFGTRIHRIEPLTEDGFLVEIPKHYWLKCSISAISPFDADPVSGQLAGITTENKNTETFNPASGYPPENYRDLHVDRTQALTWLRSAEARALLVH